MSHKVMIRWIYDWIAKRQSNEEIIVVYSSRIIIQAAHHCHMEVNHHIKSRKDVHFNILSDYAKSVLHSREEAKVFVDYVKHLSRGGRPDRTIAWRLAGELN